MTSRKPLQTIQPGESKKEEKPKPFHKGALSIAIETETKGKDKEKKSTQNKEANRSLIENPTANKKIEANTMEETKSQTHSPLKEVEAKPKPPPKNLVLNPYTRENLISKSWKFIGVYIMIIIDS